MRLALRALLLLVVCWLLLRLCAAILISCILSNSKWSQTALCVNGRRRLLELHFSPGQVPRLLPSPFFSDSFLSRHGISDAPIQVYTCHRDDIGDLSLQMSGTEPVQGCQDTWKRASHHDQAPRLADYQPDSSTPESGQ